jgi:hypothetical protein
MGRRRRLKSRAFKSAVVTPGVLTRMKCRQTCMVGDLDADLQVSFWPGVATPVFLWGLPARPVSGLKSRVKRGGWVRRPGGEWLPSGPEKNQAQRRISARTFPPCVGAGTSSGVSLGSPATDSWAWFTPRRRPVRGSRPSSSRRRGCDRRCSREPSVLLTQPQPPRIIAVRMPIPQTAARTKPWE